MFRDWMSAAFRSRTPANPHAATPIPRVQRNLFMCLSLLLSNAEERDERAHAEADTADGLCAASLHRLGSLRPRGLFVAIHDFRAWAFCRYAGGQHQLGDGFDCRRIGTRQTAAVSFGDE